MSGVVCWLVRLAFEAGRAQLSRTCAYWVDLPMYDLKLKRRGAT